MLRYNNLHIPYRVTTDPIPTNLSYKDLCEYYIYDLQFRLCDCYTFWCIYENCAKCLCSDDNKRHLIKYLQNVNFGDKSYD